MSVWTDVLTVDDYSHYEALARSTRRDELDAAMFLAGRFKRKRAALAILDQLGTAQIRHLRGPKRFKSDIVFEFSGLFEAELSKGRARRRGLAWSVVRKRALRGWSCIVAAVFMRYAWKQFVTWAFRPDGHIARRLAQAFRHHVFKCSR
jgi:hypothetical protein